MNQNERNIKRWQQKSYDHIYGQFKWASMFYLICAVILFIVSFYGLYLNDRTIWFLIGAIQLIAAICCFSPCFWYGERVKPVEEWTEPLYVREHYNEIEEASDINSIQKCFHDKRKIKFFVDIGFIPRKTFREIGPLLVEICEHKKQIDIFEKHFGTSGLINEDLQNLKNELDAKSEELLERYQNIKEQLLNDIPKPEIDVSDLI